MQKQEPSSISEMNNESEHGPKEPWAKPQVQELEVRQGTLGGNETGGSDTFLWS